MTENIFNKPRINPRDLLLIGIAVVLAIVFVIGYLQANSLQSFGTIYFYLTIIIFVFALGAIGSKFQIFDWVIYGIINNDKSFLIRAIIGIAIGFFLIFGLQSFSISIPLSVSGAGTNNLVTYLVLGFFGPLIEEIFWIGTFVPSLSNFLKPYLGFVILGGTLVPSTLALFLGVTFLGEIGFGIAILLLLTTVIEQTKQLFVPLSKIPVNKFSGGMVIGAVMITALHVYAYGNLTTNWQLFLGAFIFFIIEGFVDYKAQSIIPSIMMHVTNNAFIGATLLGITTIMGIPAPYIMILIMFLFLWTLTRSEFKYIRNLSFPQERFIRNWNPVK